MKHPIYILSVISKDNVDLDYTIDLNVVRQISIEMIEKFKEHINLEDFEKNPNITLDSLIQDLKENNEIDVYIHDNDYKNDLNIVYRNQKLDFVMTLTNKNNRKTIYRLNKINDLSKL